MQTICSGRRENKKHALKFNIGLEVYLLINDRRTPTDTPYKFPLASCSRSIASNKLLKFPAPNPSKLFL